MEPEEEEAGRKRAASSPGPAQRLLLIALPLLLLPLSLSAPNCRRPEAGHWRTSPFCLMKGGVALAAAAANERANVTLSDLAGGATNSSDASDSRPTQIHNRPNEINKQVAPAEPSNSGESARARAQLDDNGRAMTEATQHLERQQEAKQTMTNDVLCNSRCDCLQLQFLRRPRATSAADKTHERGRARDSAQDAAQTSSGHQEAPTTKQADLNQIALIEFGQDYSFDEAPGALDELAELPDDRAAAGQQLEPASGGRAPEADEAGSGGPLMWLPAAPQLPLPPLPAGFQLDRGGAPSATSNQLVAAKLDQVGAGSGDRPTIKMVARSGDQSSVSVRASARQKAAALLDPLNPSFITLSASSLGRNLSAPAAGPVPPTPLNGNALLLPSFKQPKKQSQQAKASAGRHLAQSSPKGATLEQKDDDYELLAEKISPLRSLNLSDRKLSDLSARPLEAERERNLTQLLIETLASIERDRVQSLSLRQNNIKFELWTQLYSLLLPQLRTQLHRLDLSHNSLVKLGVTFTGYIEHHFVYQLVKSNGSDFGWPFSVVPPGAGSATATDQATQSSATLNSSTASELPATTTAQSSYMKLLSQFKLSASSTSALPATGGANSKRLFRRPILGDGRLYSAVRVALPLISEEGAGSSWLNNSSLDHSNQLDPSLPSQHNSSATYQQLVQLLLHQPAQLKALDLSHNKLKWLINDQFRVLKRLQALRLDHNRIRFIHQQAFNGLTELKYLNLNFNRLQTIYMEQFQTNYKLLGLFVRANYLTYLRAGSLASLGQLRRLDLARNKFTIMSSNAFVGLESLELLNLSSNSFVHVPSASFHPLVGSLKQLDLSDNQLAQLMPGAFFHLEQLERLALNDNDQLVSIDRGAFWDLARLSHLSLRSNSQLLDINAQAFVGVPQLKAIQVDECPLLDRQTRQMLDNITAANTMRTILKQQQQQQQQQQQRPMIQELASSTSDRISSSTERSEVELGIGPKEGEQTISKHNGSLPSTQTQLGRLVGRTEDEAAQRVEQKGKLFVSDEQTSYQQQMSIQLQQDEKNATQKITKYFYCLGALALCVLALKLVFKFTSTRRYLELRRRRRRVYQSSASESAHSSSHSSIMEADCGVASMRTKGNSAGETGELESAATSRRTRARSCTSQSFGLVEQQPHNVIQRQLVSRRANSVPTNELALDADQVRLSHENVDQLQPLELASDEMSEIDLSATSSSECPAECCPDCLSQRQMEPETGAPGHQPAPLDQLLCCDQSVGQSASMQQLAAQMSLRADAAYANDELLRDLAAASGLCALEQAHCSHCYQYAHYRQQSQSPTALACCELTAQQQQQQQDYYPTEAAPTQPLDDEVPPEAAVEERAQLEGEVKSHEQRVATCFQAT